jgi:WD40-like Beta Propeller Repeat
VKAVDGDELRRLTSTPQFHEAMPAWAPDGRQIAYYRPSCDVLATVQLRLPCYRLPIRQPSLSNVLQFQRNNLSIGDHVEVGTPQATFAIGGADVHVDLVRVTPPKRLPASLPRRFGDSVMVVRCPPDTHASGCAVRRIDARGYRIKRERVLSLQSIRNPATVVALDYFFAVRPGRVLSELPVGRCEVRG